ncbi:MAG: UbiA family prenyltransferase [Sandaracinaceae bacterium]
MLSSLARLARPKVGLYVALLPIAGYGYGLWERGSTRTPREAAGDVGLLGLAWFLGHVGTVWLNAVLDRDEGGVLLGRPAAVPRGTSAAAYLALAGSVALAATLHTGAAALAAGCALLAVLYSHPATAWKGHPLAGPCVNVLGYGLASPLGGWVVASTPLTARTLLTLGIGVPFIVGAYLAAQAWQGPEDRARGYRTLVARVGPRTTLRLARACFLAGAGALALATAVGLYPRALLVALPAYVWADRWMQRWLEAPGGGSSAHASVLVGRLGLAALLTVGAAYGHQAYQLVHGLPPGGLGTAWVPPPLFEPPRPHNRLKGAVPMTDGPRAGPRAGTSWAAPPGSGRPGIDTSRRRDSSWRFPSTPTSRRSMRSET